MVSRWIGCSAGTVTVTSVFDGQCSQSLPRGRPPGRRRRRAARSPPASEASCQHRPIRPCAHPAPGCRQGEGVTPPGGGDLPAAGRRSPDAPPTARRRRLQGQTRLPAGSSPLPVMAFAASSREGDASRFTSPFRECRPKSAARSFRGQAAASPRELGLSRCHPARVAH